MTTIEAPAAAALKSRHLLGVAGLEAGEITLILDTAVHRAGMHDDDVGLRALHALRRQAEEGEVLARRGDEVAVHALVLDAQHHDHVRRFDGLLDRRRRADAEARELRRHECRGAAGPHLRAHLVQQEHVRAQDTAVEQVADDGDLQAVEALLVLADGERVEQGLQIGRASCRERV